MPSLLTPQGAKLKPERPLPDYPRPQMMRDSFFNLNGLWQYAVTAEGEPPTAFDGYIVVPFCPESLLSGVTKPVAPEAFLWYRRSFRLPAGFAGDRVLLHFGAVDQCCVVSVNGTEAGRHDGGYLPFYFDITLLLQPGENEVLVMVIDETDKAPYARGRQRLAPGGEWHTPVSGIWQTVWLESVPDTYITSLRITPLYDQQAVEFCVESSGGPMAGTLDVFAQSTRTAGAPFRTGEPFRVELPNAISWHPGMPFLYKLRAAAGRDAVASYFGMRKFSVETGPDGHARLMLNNRPLLISGIIDDGVFSDGLYTPASDDALEEGIRFARKCGFNAIRLRGKVEALRWYHHCDRLGMLVWQDLPGGGDEPKKGFSDLLFSSRKNRRDGVTAYRFFGRENAEGRENFRRDLEGTAHLLFNTVSLAAWTLFDEGYGQFDAAGAAAAMRAADPTRPIDHASGWHDQKAGDFLSVHSTGAPPMAPHSPDPRVFALTSVGGYGLEAIGHFFGDSPTAPLMVKNAQELESYLQDLYCQQLPPLVAKGLCAVFYSRLADLGDYVDGLLSHDRAIVKIPATRWEAFNEAFMRAALQPDMG